MSSWATCGWIAGTTWIALQPVPRTAVRTPARSTSWRQRAVWNAGPANESSPGIAGMLGCVSWPGQAISTSASCVPADVSRIQRSSSQRAEVTSVPVITRSSRLCRRATSSR